MIVDTRLLWEERKRLIEDVRQLADEVLATADDAIERVKLPEPLLEREAGPEEPAESPTAEVELDLLPGGAGEPEAESSEYEEQPLPEELPEDAVGASPSEEAPPADDAPEDEPRGEHASRGPARLPGHRARHAAPDAGRRGASGRAQSARGGG